MNIALIGYGKMGKMIEQIALDQGHKITAIVDPFAADSANGVKIAKSITDANFDSADAAIEFTQPDTVVTNLVALAERKIPVVTGTTGWFEHMEKVKKAFEKAGGALLWASNFSIGVNMFYRIVWYAAKLANTIPPEEIPPSTEL